MSPFPGSRLDLPAVGIKGGGEWEGLNDEIRKGRITINEITVYKKNNSIKHRIDQHGDSLKYGWAFDVYGPLVLSRRVNDDQLGKKLITIRDVVAKLLKDYNGKDGIRVQYALPKVTR
jgi:hypothetical protein